MLYRVPNQRIVNGFILMPIHVAGSGNAYPINLTVALFQRIRKTTRGLGDDLQSTGDSVNRLPIGDIGLERHIRSKISDGLNIFQNIR